MDSIPRERTLDSTLAFLRDGYEFISKRCDRYHSDIFETRLMLEPAICMRGEAAARVFYDGKHFTRRGGAMPPTTLRLLQDKGSVQLLDGRAHLHRKRMFMALMTPESIERLVDLMEEAWREALRGWVEQDEVVLLDAVRRILCRAVCRWSGVPLPADAVQARTEQLAALIDGSGSPLGPRLWWGAVQRVRAEHWLRAVVEQVRAGELTPAAASAIHEIAWHRDLDGRLLEVEIAAVELLNVLRPTVAVARFIVFAALALHEHPQWRQRLTGAGDQELECFVQEVRRFYPFFPVIAGRVREAFSWRGVRFPEGRRVMLDMYGTNRDPRVWEEPEQFRPERFRNWGGGAYDLIPQGAGDYYREHRCPGEPITIELMKRAVRLLNEAMDYCVPDQDLGIDLSRLPAIPSSRFKITDISPA